MVTSIVTVVVNPLPVINMTWSPDVTTPDLPGPANICVGDDVFLYSGSNGLNYQWSPGGNTTGFIHPNPVTTTTTYTVLVTNSNGCSNTGTITVNAIPSPILTVTSNNITCFGQGNGSAAITVNPANDPPYSYYWSPTGQTTSSITGLNPSTYSATATHATGCSSTITVNITQPPLLGGTASANPTSVCIGNSAVLSATVTGGTPNYSYNWSPSADLLNPNAASTTATPTVTTVYSVTITDANGCSIVRTATVVVKPLPVRRNRWASNSACQSPDTYCSPLISGYNYVWTVPPGATFTSLPPGNCISRTGNCILYWRLPHGHCHGCEWLY